MCNRSNPLVTKRWNSTYPTAILWSRWVDWTAFDAYWPRLYGAVGKPSADPLVCFKLRLLVQWRDLSDPQCEAQCADRLSFRRFLGLSLADTIPDETVLVRFRKRLLKAGIAEERFTTVLARVEAAGVMFKRGALMNQWGQHLKYPHEFTSHHHG